MPDKQSRENRPIIVFTKYTPYNVADIEKFTSAEGKDLPTEPVMTLCRCGGSKHKPYCDGTHSKIGFVGKKSPDRVKDKVKEYRGKEITIVDNRGVCAHDASCTDCLPSVFNVDKRPWIDPNGATMDEIIQTIEKCPSGALSYRLGEKRYQDQVRTPSIKVARDGPLQVTGFVEMKDDMESAPESEEHYALCRCGDSKNKPFCDGTHHETGFKDG
jgi:CDGSH-type Zn-finger protein